VPVSEDSIPNRTFCTSLLIRAVSGNLVVVLRRLIATLTLYVATWLRVSPLCLSYRRLLVLLP
jgi:hypothetical protein